MNVCTQSGKTAFATAQGAWVQVTRLTRKKRHDRMDGKFAHGPLCAYRCACCGGFHVGHKAKDKVAA